MTGRFDTRAWLLACAAGLLLVGCDTGPKEAYYGMATAAEMGDREGFLAGFTKDSRPLLEAQISLSEAYGLKKDNPVKQLVFKSVDAVEITDDKAILQVSSGSKRTKILMVKTEEEGWRIDVRTLAEFWSDKKNRR